MYHGDVTGSFGNSVVSELSQSCVFLVRLLRGTDSNANYEHSLHYGKDNITLALYNLWDGRPRYEASPDSYIVCMCVSEIESGPAELDDKI